VETVAERYTWRHVAERCLEAYETPPGEHGRRA
jgi:hypothetical protein